MLTMRGVGGGTEMLTTQGGHMDVNNAGWPLRSQQGRVAIEMLTMQGGH